MHKSKMMFITNWFLVINMENRIGKLLKLNMFNTV